MCIQTLNTYFTFAHSSLSNCMFLVYSFIISWSFYIGTVLLLKFLAQPAMLAEYWTRILQELKEASTSHMAALEWEGFWRRIDWLGMYVLKCWLSPVWIILAARHLQNLVGNWAVWVAWGLPLRQDVESIWYRVLFLPFILSGFSLVKAACCRDFTHPPAPNKTVFFWRLEFYCC